MHTHRVPFSLPMTDFSAPASASSFGSASLPSAGVVRPANLAALWTLLQDRSDAATAAAVQCDDGRPAMRHLGQMLVAHGLVSPEQVRATLKEGATLLLGAEKIAGAGNYYAPTVLGNVTAEMTGFRQELFGPVATITEARDADHALALANDSEFGLSATVYTTSEAQAQRFADELECGGVFINGYCASDARVAFGGVKKSGFGRELSHFGLHEFCNVQTVWRDRR